MRRYQTLATIARRSRGRHLARRTPVVPVVVVVALVPVPNQPRGPVVDVALVPMNRIQNLDTSNPVGGDR